MSFISFSQDHYARAWFRLWEPRWYGGTEVVGHPPLVHQLVALGSWLPGANIERAYALLLLLTALLFVLGMGALGEALEGTVEAGRAALLGAAYPVLYLFLFPYGQLPFVFAISGMLLGTSFILNGLRRERTWRVVSGVLLCGAGAAAHPWGILSFAAVPAAVLVNNPEWRRPTGWGVPLALATCILLLCLVVAHPFWIWLQRDGYREVMSSKIDFGINFKPGIAWMGIGSVGAGVAIYAGKSTASRVLGWGTFLCMAVFVLLSMQSGIAADKSLWLGGVCSILAISLAQFWDRSEGKTIFALTLLLFGLGAAASLGGHDVRTTRKFRTTMAEVAGLLSQREHQAWRYLTLGVGNERLELGRRAAAGDLGGGFPWGPGHEFLRGTSYESLDALPLAERRAQEVLAGILSDADRYSLRWVIAAGTEATPLLEAAGFEMRHAWRTGLLLWEKPDVPAVASSEETMPTTLRARLWGILPVLCLILGVVAVFL